MSVRQEVKLSRFLDVPAAAWGFAQSVDETGTTNNTKVFLLRLCVYVVVCVAIGAAENMKKHSAAPPERFYYRAVIM